MIVCPISVLSRKAIFLMALVLNAPANAQQEATQPFSRASEVRVLQELVNEVKQLRLALVQTNAISSRLQITLQRIQLQQNQVNRISVQLESIRSQILRSEAEQGQASSNLANLESRLDQEQNPNSQKALQEEQKFMKALAEQKARVVQDERTREAELTSSLQVEQGKLSELQARLDSLEGLMSPQPAQ